LISHHNFTIFFLSTILLIITWVMFGFDKSWNFQK
jgi:ammonia channel protein AmtB